MSKYMGWISPKRSLVVTVGSGMSVDTAFAPDPKYFTRNGSNKRSDPAVAIVGSGRSTDSTRRLSNPCCWGSKNGSIKLNRFDVSSVMSG